MSFSYQVKNELIKIEYDKNCCKKSLLYGMALFAKTFSFRSFTLQSENENTIILFKRLLKECCNIDANVATSPSGKTFAVSLARDSASKLFNYFGHDKSETSLKINFTNFSCQNCQKAFFAGAFLSCGTVSSPEKNYHLEFAIPYLNLTKTFVTFLQELELTPKQSKRGGYNIVYFKDSEAIEDSLYIMGAASSMFEMMNIEIVKDLRNNANRKANCETANIEKMVKAASPQISAITKIQQTKGLDFLSAPLKEMAIIRLENPDLSLQELSQLFDPPLSKSGINHRLKRIVDIANNLD